MKNTLLMILLFFCLKAAAQKTDFPGKWTIDKSKIEFGQTPEWVAPGEFTITQEKSKFTIIRVLRDAQMQQHPDTAILSFDGKVYQNWSYSHKKQNYSLQWNADQKTFTITIHNMTADDQPSLDITENWSLSDDRKTLLIDRHVEQATGLKYDLKLYYDKL